MLILAPDAAQVIILPAGVVPVVVVRVVLIVQRAAVVRAPLRLPDIIQPQGPRPAVLCHAQLESIQQVERRNVRIVYLASTRISQRSQLV